MYKLLVYDSVTDWPHEMGHPTVEVYVPQADLTFNPYDNHIHVWKGKRMDIEKDKGYELIKTFELNPDVVSKIQSYINTKEWAEKALKEVFA